ncbi:MAG TPA: branched-chain amino acid ABC transporter permease [Rhizobiaceae bacterium]|nr:branched-chain amino acid ABC transporter permease [Rhizobiaceae bacterium]
MSGFLSDLRSEEKRSLAIGAVIVAVAALLPLFDQGFYLSISVNIMLYAALCTAWSLFSGPTHYVSLATAAFYGLGTYSVGLGIDILPYPVLLLIAASVGAVVAGLVGAMTLRISGVYFVIFTFGLAEFVRQLFTWTQTKFATAMGLYVFTDFMEQHIYWMLLALTAVVFLTGFLINRSRLGFAMTVIGNDETVARHVGIDTARAKIILFMVSGAFIAIAGAITAPRYTYIEPPSAFNPMISFLVVIMALLGGTRRLWGPLVGVIPFTIMMDIISSRFPNHTSIVIGLAFFAIVYLLPDGVTGRLEQLRTKFRARKAGDHAPAIVEKQA